MLFWNGAKVSNVDSKGTKMPTSCTSRIKMPHLEYGLAKEGCDTAENERRVASGKVENRSFNVDYYG